MAPIKAGTLVTGLLTAALITVGVLTAVASGAPEDRVPGVAAARTAGKAGTQEGAGSAGGAARGAGRYGLPAGSGLGDRVVYSLGRRRVWLVDDEEQVLRTYRVVGGSVRPAVGPHRVFARRAKGSGGDGMRVEHVVLFARTGTTNVGFSAAVDGSLDPPDPTKHTAAVRQSRADASALWLQATIGCTVQVVP